MINGWKHTSRHHSQPTDLTKLSSSLFNVNVFHFISFHFVKFEALASDFSTLVPMKQAVTRADGRIYTLTRNFTEVYPHGLYMFLFIIH